MEIDETLLKIIFSVFGFVFFALNGIIIWLFRSIDSTIKLIGRNQGDLKLELTKLSADITSVKNSIHREIDLINNSVQNNISKTENNSQYIKEINKELGQISQWKKYIENDKSN